VARRKHPGTSRITSILEHGGICRAHRRAGPIYRQVGGPVRRGAGPRAVKSLDTAWPRHKLFSSGNDRDLNILSSGIYRADGGWPIIQWNAPRDSDKEKFIQWNLPHKQIVL
jgi:hypothetical protein